MGGVALSDSTYDYPAGIITDIAVDDAAAYSAAADFINERNFDVLSVQHEYGIFGGKAGEYVLRLIRALDIPVVCTLHTVLRSPTPAQRRVMQELLALSARIVVMSRTAIELLSEVHGVDLSKVDYIPHGVPKVPAGAGAALRAHIGGAGPILLTFGLLSPDKGIENAIRAMPEIAAKFPDARYLVVGATHPNVKAHAGETYRESLVELTRQLGMEKHVSFVDRFVSLAELTDYLGAMDFYITPYLNPMQITSGTLAYSLAAGKVVISTPYEYAKEILADGRGILVDFASPQAISRAVEQSYADRESSLMMMRKAAVYAGLMGWDRIGKLYLRSFRQALVQSRYLPKPDLLVGTAALPDIELGHLEAMTDDTGMLQHATFSVPNRSEGYCVDDNARALLLTVQVESMVAHDKRIRQLQSRCLAFVADAFDSRIGKFRNFMSYRREWLEAYGSDDSQGRSLWALGVTAGRSSNPGHARMAGKLFESSACSMDDSTSPRAWAYAILGCAAFIERWPDSVFAKLMLESLAHKLSGVFTVSSTESWPWPEPRLSYANARIPQSLILAGNIMGAPEITGRGIDALTWLMEHQVSAGGRFSPVGTLGAGPEDFGSLQFDQQPIEAGSSVSACLAAFGVTRNRRFIDLANWCFSWFTGTNVHSTPLAMTQDGSCFDGLNVEGLNQNQGAESTLCYLNALAELRLAGSGDLVRTPRGEAF